jgi:hypothetical protein
VAEYTTGGFSPKTRKQEDVLAEVPKPMVDYGLRGDSKAGTILGVVAT